MQNLNQDLEREKKLARRSWQGLLLMFGIALGIVLGTSALMFVFSRISPGIHAISAPWILIGVILLGGFLLILGIGGIVLLLYIMRWSMEGQKQNFMRGTQVLQSTMPQLLSETDTKTAQSLFTGKSFVKLLLWLPIYLVGFSVLTWGIRSTIHRFLPDAPRWLSDAIFWLLVLGIMLPIGWLTARRHEKQGGEKASSPKTFLLNIVSWLFFLAFTTIPLFGLFPLLKGFHSLVVLPFALIGFLLGFGFLAMVYLVGPMLWVLAALKRADYEQAVRRSLWVEQIHAFHGAFLNLRGFVLVLAGRYEEAKQLLQEGIRATRKELAAGGADGLDNIGCALTAQGQYEEAIKMFEGAVKISPQHVGAFNDLAQAYLFQSLEPERALELTERALKNYHASSFLAKWLESFNFASIHANRAWALALLGRHSEATQALEQAFAGADRSFVPEFAGLHYRAGKTELLLDHQSKAVEHWNEARTLDLHGHYGALADQALRDLGAQLPNT